MRRLLFLLFFALTSIAVTAQPVYTDSTLYLRPIYRAGDRLEYRVVQERVWESPTKRYAFASEVRVTVEVREADTSRGYLLEYSVRFISAGDSVSPVYALQAKALDGLRFHYRLDRRGRYAGLVDTAAVRQYLIGRLAGATKPERWRAADEKYWQRELEAFANDRELREYLSPLGLIHSGNHRLWRTLPRRVDARRLRMHSADTARGTQDLWLEGVDPLRNTAQYRVAFQGLDGTSGDTIFMDYDYSVELNTGWLQRLQVETTRARRKGFKKTVIELVPSS